MSELAIPPRRMGPVLPLTNAELLRRVELMQSQRHITWITAAVEVAADLWRSHGLNLTGQAVYVRAMQARKQRRTNNQKGDPDEH